MLSGLGVAYVGDSSDWNYQPPINLHTGPSIMVEVDPNLHDCGTKRIPTMRAQQLNHYQPELS
jgi:hypothetical protein